MKTMSVNFTINKNLTTTNYSTGVGVSRIKYIVIHYTANNGDTAWGNTNFFKKAYRGASAHYFVDENSIWQCVEDKNVAWHCGGDLQGSSGHSYFRICYNTNSIGIEMCSRVSNGRYYFKDEVITNTVKLVKYLMSKYNIPVSNIIRHYDVTGKICPEPMVKDISQWTKFKARLVNKEEEELAKTAIKVYDKQNKNTVSVTSVTLDNENYIRLRDMEKFGIDVDYDKTKDLPIVDTRRTTFTLPVDVDGVLVNPEAVKQDDKNFIGVRTLLEGLGYTVGWDEVTGTVTATIKK